MGWMIGSSSPGRGWEFFFSPPRLGATQPPIQWVSGALFLGVKRPGHETHHSPPSSAEVRKCVDLYLHSLNTPSWHGAQFKKKHMGNFTFTFTNFLYEKLFREK
jgi:hypothetical protein